MQGGIRCFSLATGQILRRAFNDITQTKWAEESLGWMRYINKKQKSVKGLLFGDRQRDIESTIFPNSDLAEDILTERDAFEHDVYNLHDSNDTESVDEIDAVVDDDTYTPSNREEEDYIEEDYIDESKEEDLVTAENNDNNSPDINESEDNSMINSDNNANELPDVVTAEDPEETIDPVTTTRSGRTSKPFDYESNCPGIYTINYADDYRSVNGGKTNVTETNAHFLLYCEALD